MELSRHRKKTKGKGTALTKKDGGTGLYVGSPQDARRYDRSSGQAQLIVVTRLYLAA